MKKVLTVISCILVMVITMQSSFAMSSPVNSDSQILIENMDILNNELSAQNTDVIQELSKMIEQYEQMLSVATQANEIEQLNNLIETLKELSADYQSYSNGSVLRKYHIIYSPAVATVIAYFNAKNYLLAAELLTHAKENTNPNSSYIPNFGARTRLSNVITQLADQTATTGAASFEPGDRPVDMDLYYAIHNFDYSKSSPTARVIIIVDYYDYEYEDYDGTIATVAVSTMAKAQQAGVITPYWISISVDAFL